MGAALWQPVFSILAAPFDLCIVSGCEEVVVGTAGGGMGACEYGAVLRPRVIERSQPGNLVHLPAVYSA